jgi:hypothetical protein
VSYDPIPADVREAYAALVEVSEAHGLKAGSLTLFASRALDEGEDVEVEGHERPIRYWPRCGGPQPLTVCSYQEAP